MNVFIKFKIYIVVNKLFLMIWNIKISIGK